MKRLSLSLGIVFLLSGCASIRDAMHPPGEMGADGKVNPCHGFQTNPQACGNAIYNAAHVIKLSIGQTLQQAREVMGRDPEERTLKKQGEQTIEVWKYLIAYRSTSFSVITFVDEKIVSIETAQR
ncbi:MAG: hypothetical protein HZB47_13995 [Nitrosomonadales bacterium]|nr:hypothetical protein [Nitrosomonadales bacterium]